MKKCSLGKERADYSKKQPFMRSFAIILMFCLLFQSVLPNISAKADGNGRYIHALYDEATDSVVFKVKADSALYGFVMCKANNWSPNDEYKFERKADDTDKNKEMEVSIKYDKLISTEQVREYKVTLKYENKNDLEWMTDDGGNKNENSKFPERTQTQPPVNPEKRNVSALTSYDEAKNTVAFTVTAPDFDYGYIMCRANKWSINDLNALNDYKLIKEADGKFKAVISYDKLSPTDNVQINGLWAWQEVNQYKLYLHHATENKFYWLDADGKDIAGVNSKFEAKSNFSTDPWVISALIDDENDIKLFLKKGYKEKIGEEPKFEASVDGAEYKEVEAAIENQNDYDLVKLPLANICGNTFDTRKQIYIRRKNASTTTKVLARNVLDKFNYTGDDLGVKFADNGISVKVWAPTTTKAEILVYDTYAVFKADKSSGTAHEMNYDATTGIYSTVLEKTDKDKYYLFRFHFGENVVRYAVDPYANAVGLNGVVGALTDINADDVKPEGFAEDIRPELKNPEDSILYEMHVRDFTIDENWNGTKEKAGKYLGVIEEGTKYTVNGKIVSTGLDHIKDLGITHVHLLPTYDFSSTDEAKANDKDERNWGYDPQNYNVPEGSYSSNPENPKTRIKEYREMVMGLHKAGIRVVNDVVYNHMAGTDNMDSIVPGYYFRSYENGIYSNDSGCGNAVASERPMIRKFIVDSCKHWIKDYKTDGLRFDLMAILDVDTMNLVKTEIQKTDPSLIVYGEPWMADNSPLPDDKRTTKNKGIAYFNDTFRDALRGNNNTPPSSGFVSGDSSKNGTVLYGMRASDGDPEYTINYVEAHDNYPIWDQFEKNQNHGINAPDYRKNVPDNAFTDMRVRKALLANAFVMLSQGIPFYQGGSEILRTKQGDHNSYKSSDETNDFDWGDKAEFSEVFDYYKGLIKFRKAHPAFRLTNADSVKELQDVNRLNNDDSLIFQHLKNKANGDSFEDILVLYNVSGEKKHIKWLPKNVDWKVVANHEKIDFNNPIKTVKPDNTTNVERYNFDLEPYSLMIMYNTKANVNENADIHWHYLFADQSKDYMTPLEPSATDEVKVRFRAKANELTEAKLHYYVNSEKKIVAMNKVSDDFYTENGYDSTKVEFWEGTIPAGKETKYYHFEAINKRANGTKTAWISTGKGDTGFGISNNEPSYSSFSVVPNYKTSNWSKESIIYQIMVDRFRDGDTKNNKDSKDFSNSGAKPEISTWGSPITNGNETDKIWNNQFFGGDLTGVKEALPYLTDNLGVNALYFMPIFQSDSDHKYDNDTYEYVDNNFGGNKGLAELGKALEDKNINYILDGVFNHTSATGSLYKANKDKFYFQGAFKDGAGKSIPHYPWHGFSNFAKLDYSKEATKNYIYKAENSVAKTFLKAPYFADGWRLDAAEDLNSEPRDFKENGKEDDRQKANNLKIWKDFHDSVRKVSPDSFILGEFWGDNSQWYYGNAWDGKMNYGGFYLPFIENSQKQKYFDGKQSLDNKGEYSVADIAKYTRDYLKKFPYSTALNSTNSISTHDKMRFLNQEYSGKDNTAMMTLAQTLQLTYIGIPMIYYGDEIGTFGDKGGNDPYNRQTFNWNDDEWNYDILNNYRSLIAARKANKDAFVYGAFEEIKSDSAGKYLVYARYGNKERAIVMLNNNGNTQSTSITLSDLDRYGFKNGDKLVDVLSGKKLTVNGASLELPTAGMSAACYVLEAKSKAVEKLDKDSFDVNTVLSELNDTRTKLSVPENIHFTKNGNDTVVKYSLKNENGQKSVLIRVTNKGETKIIKDIVTKTAIKSVNIGTLPKDSKIFVKVLADRDLTDGTVKDVYMDSDYKEAVYKNETPNNPNKPNNPNTPNLPGTPNVPNTQNAGGGFVPPVETGKSEGEKLKDTKIEKTVDSEEEQLKVDDSKTPLASMNERVEVNLDEMPVKNKTITLTAKSAKKIIEELKSVSDTKTVVLNSKKLIKKGFTIKMSQGFLKKFVTSKIKNLNVEAGNWYISFDKKKLNSLSTSSKQITVTMKEVKPDNTLMGKKYKAVGNAVILEVNRNSLKNGKKHNIIIPVTAKYSSYNKTLNILKSTGKKAFKSVKKIKFNKAAKEVTALLKSVKQTVILVINR